MAKKEKNSKGENKIRKPYDNLYDCLKEGFVKLIKGINNGNIIKQNIKKKL